MADVIRTYFAAGFALGLVTLSICRVVSLVFRRVMRIGEGG